MNKSNNNNNSNNSNNNNNNNNNNNICALSLHLGKITPSLIRVPI